MVSGSLFLVLLATTLLIATGFHFVKLTLLFLVVILVFFFKMVWYWIISKKYQCKKYIIPFEFIAILCSYIFVSGIFYDFSYDGQSYHQATVLQLINGFNSVYDQVGGTPFNITETYPRAAELNAAALYKITDNIKKSKSSNIVLIITTFLLTLAIILSVTKIKIEKSFVIAFLITVESVGY